MAMTFLLNKGELFLVIIIKWDSTIGFAEYTIISYSENKKSINDD